MPKSPDLKPISHDQIQAILEECKKGLACEGSLRPAIYGRVVDLIDEIPGWAVLRELSRARGIACGRLGVSETDGEAFNAIHALVVAARPKERVNPVARTG